MEARKKVSFLALMALLVSGLLLTSCPENTPGEKPNGGEEEPARPVRVTVQPNAIRKTLAEWNALSPADKTFTVTLSEQKAATYQWYSRPDRTSEGTLIPGETKSTFTPTPPITAEGSYNYFVVVKVDGKEIQSNNALIKIIDMSGQAKTQFTIGTERVHYVRGVGGTGSFMFRDGDNADASPDADVRYIELLMGQIGCNILRIMVQDDYKNYENNSVKSRNDLAFPHDAKRNFFAVIRKVNELGGYVFANPWTAPASMKTPQQLRGRMPGQQDSATGGSFLTKSAENYIAYADHLRDFLTWLNENNAPIFALGILNEPDWGNRVEYEGMGMTSNDHRDWFKTVGHFTTQKAQKSGASIGSATLTDAIIKGYGGGKPTHHVLVMTGDGMGDPAFYTPTIDDADANKNFEILGRHWYAGNTVERISKVAGVANTTWADRPSGYTGRLEADSLRDSPQMFAPGSTAGNIKREVWQTEHDFNYWSDSTNIPSTNVQRYWNSAFAAMNDVDWAMRVVHESVFDWWFSSSYSGLVTSYQGTPVNAGGIKKWTPDAMEWAPYTYTPRGRAFAHYARYVNETWSLPIEQTKEKTGTNMKFNQTGTSASAAFNAGSVDPKISAFEDVNGKFISIVMFAPNASTNTSPTAASSSRITNAFGQGGRNGTNDPTRLSADVGRVEVILPDGFTPSGASALRSYGWENATGEDWDDVATGTPRYWINERVFPYQTDGKWAVEVTLPGGNIISIMVRGTWAGRQVASPERVRPYTVN